MCTGVRLIAENGAVAYGRTLEFGQPTESNIIIIPRNYTFTGTAPSGKAEGLSWKSRYAVVGANAFNMPVLLDGVNEKGLAGGLFYFPDYAEYQDVTQDQIKNSLAPWELLTWILTNFATVAEVRKALPTIKVGNTVYGPWKIVPPVHAIVHDSAGNSIVIEYLKGELVVYDNPLGVITNSPNFDWHLTNLRNYSNLTPVNVGKIKLGSLTLTPLGQGSGMLGLPGDFTPPSRFVRAVAYSKSIIASKTEQEAVNNVFHILNLFNIPLGVIREKAETSHRDCTQWTTAADLSHKRYYWHTYDNRNVQMVDLMKVDLTQQEPIIIQMERKETIANLTP